jgi:hypothetical protein
LIYGWEICCYDFLHRTAGNSDFYVARTGPFIPKSRVFQCIQNASQLGKVDIPLEGRQKSLQWRDNFTLSFQNVTVIIAGELSVSFRFRFHPERALVVPTKHHLKALKTQAGAVASNVCAQGPNKENDVCWPLHK